MLKQNGDFRGILLSIEIYMLKATNKNILNIHI